MFDGAYPPGVTGAMIDRLDIPDCCGNCRLYDGDHCMKEWNNFDRDYYLPERDDKQPDEWCKDYEGD